MKIFSLIKYIDSFSPKMEINIQKGGKFKTVLGGIITILTYILYFYFVAIFGSDFILAQILI